MSDSKYNKNKEQSIAENALKKKGVPNDGAEINHQVENKKEIHQPRDNA